MPSDFNQPMEISSEYNPFAIFFLLCPLRKQLTFLFQFMRMNLFLDLTCWESVVSVDTQVFYFINKIKINK